MKTRLLTGLMISMGLAALAGLSPNKAMIDKVDSGELKEARLSWWGFDENDSTEIIRNAMKSKATTLVVDKMQSPWVTLPVFLKSDLTLRFEEGAEIQAMKGQFKGMNDSLINIDMLSNVTIIGEGRGGILRMHKADYQGNEYKHGEWRHGVIILSSNNIRIENMASVESGGDGIYVGHNSRKSKQPYCKDVVIRKCVCDRNHRQGISVIAAVNLLIEDTRMTNTVGTAPESGIDFEPNLAKEPLVNCVMRNCVSENNNGAGFEFYLPNQIATQCGRDTVVFENCVSRNNRRAAFNCHSKNSKDYPTERPFELDFLLKNCVAEDSKSNNYQFSLDLWQKVNVRMVDCVSIDSRKGNKMANPMVIEYGRSAADGKNASMFNLENMTVKDAMAMPPVKIIDRPLYGCSRYGIRGTVKSIVNGKTTTYDYTADNMGKLFPDGNFDEISHYDYKTAGLVPANVEEHVELPGGRIRHNGNFWIYLTDGKEATFKLLYAKLTRNTGKTQTVELVGPSGKKYPIGTIDFQTTKQFTVKPPEGTGIYKVVYPTGNNWTAMTESSVPAGIVADKENGLNMIYMTGTYYFYMPKTTNTGIIYFLGDGNTEGAKITVRDSNGNVVFAEDNVIYKQLVLDGKNKSGIWSFTIEAPSKISLEDLSIKCIGISPYFTTKQSALPQNK